MNDIRIKICGITRLSDALAAIDAGADLLGLIFAPASPRNIEPEAAVALTRAIRQERPNAAVRLVGVFQNAPLAEMQRIIAQVGLDLAQLHGEEPPETAALLPIPFIRVLIADSAPETWPERLLPYIALPNFHALLLDLPKGTPAGADITSVDIPPTVLAELHRTGFFLAGRLHPDNVVAAVRRFQPTGVDVASGVELAPGQKEIGKLQAFCHNIRNG